MDYEAAYCTDTGTQKKINQDSACVMIADTSDGPVCMAFLCDGMGGISLGEYASSTVVQRFVQWFEDIFSERILQCVSLESVAEEWVRILVEIDEEFRKYGKENHLKMGTTVTGMLFWKEKYLLVQSGDSRAYEIGRTLKQLSEDQSYVQQQINMGLLSKEDAKHHPKRNILLNCIGGSRPSIPEWSIGKISKKANYLLCSDGFVHEISEKEVIHFLSPKIWAEVPRIHENLENIISTLKARGEKDNITALVIKTKHCRKGIKKDFYFHVRQKTILAEGEIPSWQKTVTTESEG